VTRFNPIGIIAQADTIRAEYIDASASGRLADPAVRSEIRGKLVHADEELALALEFYARMTPHWTKFALTFGCGLGGLLAMGPTLGWSMVLTMGSAGLALNDTRDFLDNREQMARIRLRREWIARTLQTL